jgi:hypothetical protein
MGRKITTLTAQKKSGPERYGPERRGPEAQHTTFEPLGEVLKVLQGTKNFPGGKLHRKYLSMSLVNMNDIS